MKRDFLINKQGKLTYQSGFILDGIVRSADESGVLFETAQSTSFISWISIRDIKISNRGD